MKNKIIIYCICGIVFFGLNILVLIWNFHEKQTGLSDMSLIILAITSIVCAILAILDFKDSRNRKQQEKIDKAE